MQTAGVDRSSVNVITAEASSWRYFLSMPNKLVGLLHTNTDSARWPYLDRLIDLHEMGLIAPEVWRLVCNLRREYDAELLALRERPAS